MPKTELSNAASRYGANLGRTSTQGDPDGTFKITIQWVPLDSGGYDSGGAYWGTGEPLYCAERDDGATIETEFFRAESMFAAAKELREKYPAATIDPNGLEDFLRGYIEAALFTENDDDGKPLDDYCGAADLAPECLETMKEDCADFIKGHAADIAAAIATRPDSYDMASAGRDFWFTRNRDGVGFWDRGLGHIGDKLSEAAKVYGEAYLYVDGNPESGEWTVRHG